MDDGSLHNKSQWGPAPLGQADGAKLNTQGFTKEECIFLRDLLMELYDLKVTLNKTGVADQYSLYIWKESMSKFYN